MFIDNSFNVPINNLFLYKFCKITDEGIFLVLPGLRFIEVLLGNNKLTTVTYTYDNLKDKKVNCVSYDKFKFVVGFNDNTIKVFSTKEKQLWYNLLGGSMTVIPKSFVGYIEGFHAIQLTKYSIIGCLGNLIREYSFNNNIK
jgi:hypothetical protein